MKLPDDSTSIFYVYIIDYNIVLETFIKKVCPDAADSSCQKKDFRVFICHFSESSLK